MSNKWYCVVEKLAWDGKKQDIMEALRLASECEEEDAKWLVSLFPASGAPMSPKEAMEVFMEQASKGDARAIFFAACVCSCSRPGDEQLVRRAAEAGYALAQGRMAQRTGGREKYDWAEKAAAQGDWDGTEALASCFWNGWGCEEDECKALALYKDVAELGSASASFSYGLLAFGENDLERYQWWKHAAAQGIWSVLPNLADAAVNHMKRIDMGHTVPGRIVFEIGSCCKVFVNARGNISVCNYIGIDNDTAVRRVMTLHDKWSDEAETAIRCWIWVARQENVAKDMRSLICKMLWMDRSAWSE
jgi:hypothetical protein